jgi:hypothetical protein
VRRRPVCLAAAPGPLSERDCGAMDLVSEWLISNIGIGGPVPVP